MLKSQLKTSIKNLTAAVTEGDTDSAETIYRTTVGILDRAVLKGTMHKNTANRKKSQLALVLNKAKA